MKILLHDGREEVLLRYDHPSFELCWRKQTKDKDTGEVSDTWAPQLYFMSLAQALRRYGWSIEKAVNTPSRRKTNVA